ncbi:hypothetical protein GUJ93_ZPchr0006g42227 [Zizania palustris]|uniref:Uncharacterized protein n=1 Tax=Zizania palustris TaxID=103762 RepID=A0A8J5TGJ2_ZIZPA|nr:hypothetical protein GUJ93_ZPchr0006g42227 [Zizania palustris]
MDVDDRSPAPGASSGRTPLLRPFIPPELPTEELISRYLRTGEGLARDDLVALLGRYRPEDLGTAAEEALLQVNGVSRAALLMP